MSEYIFVTNIFEYSNIRIYSSHSGLKIRILNIESCQFKGLKAKTFGHFQHFPSLIYTVLIGNTHGWNTLCSSSNISDGILKNTDFPVRPFNGVNEGWLGSFSCFGRSMHQWLAITTLLLTPANGSVYYHVVWYGFYGI